METRRNPPRCGRDFAISIAWELGHPQLSDRLRRRSDTEKMRQEMGRNQHRGDPPRGEALPRMAQERCFATADGSAKINAARFFNTSRHRIAHLDQPARRALVRTIAVLSALIAALAGCSSPQIVPLDPATPNIPALRELLHGKRKLVVMFLHGVGDHCPRYALEGRNAWISGDGFRQLGIQDSSGKPQPYRELKTPVYVSRDGTDSILVGTDHGGQIWLGDVITTETSLGTLGADGLPVEAVEITWSELTYRLKNKNLNYDLTREGQSNYEKTMQRAEMHCFGDLTLPEDAADAKPTVDPPPRAVLNRGVKESILDRALSDALLYTGRYKEVLQRAVAKGICDGITLTSDSVQGTSASASLCWVNAKAALGPRDTAYVFFTHSLGSRILYDVLNNLNRIDRYHDSPFVTGTDDAAYGVFPRFTCQIPAVYMMANQISLVGLAAGGTLSDVIAADPITQTAEMSRSTQAERDDYTLRRLHCAQRGADTAGSAPRPMWIAFTDTNDLLSWSIRPTMEHENFDFFTVFVDNFWWHWLSLYEDADAAHTGYFKNKDVGRVIACGTKNGRIRQDCRTSAAN
jgi:hypothetical protein